MITVIVALKVWPLEIRGKRFKVSCDNNGSVDVINKGSAKEHFLQQLMRELAYASVKAECLVKAVQIKGKNNILPDLLSCSFQGSKKNFWN